MSAWWYTENDQKTGPIEEADLKRLVESGRIGPRTMLWKEGTEAWQRLEEIEELQALRATVPPPLPSEVRRDSLSYPLATRWPRFFARIFDVWWETLLVSQIATGVVGRYSAGFVEWTNGPVGSQLFEMICLPVALLLDAAIYILAGSTPGKAMLGLKVGTLDGKRLNFPQYLGRNFSMWVSGLGCGIPLIEFITMGRQSIRVGEGRPASYDEGTGYRVRSKPIGRLRKFGFGFAFFYLLLIMVVFIGAPQVAQRDAQVSSEAPRYTWENPITQRSITVDPRWEYSTETNAAGDAIYQFAERTNHATTIIAVERMSGITLHDYVQTFRQENATRMRFTDGGRFFEIGKRQAWQGSGAVLNYPTNRLDVHMVHVDDAFWRVVSVQTLPFHYSDELVAELRTALLGTVQ